MDEPEYQKLADQALHRLEGLFADADPEEVDCERSGGVITLTFKGGKKCVINTQRPTRQIWLAANARAWHFSYDAKVGAWLDDKGQSVELFAMVVKIVKESVGLDLDVA
jgi:CyaY protein